MLDKNSKNTTWFQQVFLNKEARLSKSQWHYKLMKFVIGEDNIPLYNYCPYFWLTIFSIFMSPFVILYKVPRYFIIKIDSYTDKIIIKPSRVRHFAKIEKEDMSKIFLGYLYYFSKHESSLEDKEEIKFFLSDQEHMYYKYYLLSSFARIFVDWSDNTLDWEDKIEAYKLIRIADYEARQVRINSLIEREELLSKQIQKSNADAAKRKSKIRNNMIKTAKYIFFAILVPVGLLIVFAFINLCMFLYKIFTTIKLPSFYEFIYTLSIIAGIVFIFLVFIFLIKLLVEKLRNSSPTKKQSKLGKFFNTLGFYIVSTFIAIRDGAAFFIIFFKSWKSNNCPAIIWEDETNK